MFNPELRRNATPDGPYALKVPPGKGEVLTVALEMLAEVDPRLRGGIRCPSRERGETISLIAAPVRGRAFREFLKRTTSFRQNASASASG